MSIISSSNNIFSIVLNFVDYTTFKMYRNSDETSYLSVEKKKILKNDEIGKDDNSTNIAAINMKNSSKEALEQAL